ncbi:competence protein ComEC family protein [Dyadobacter sp. CY345]|uniref:ComEC/Rec2 family competence protein n=1 Tax=Dyadobacter sp. CY345 TaxID=2909335 RepID=UPI001F3A0342|nr:ComEC/Rec2 family competence protein [Dyadobacter sp. CY345]MCF2446487.1 competence protein ComEC family protein [Dyadobacter sp. CY345]
MLSRVPFVGLILTFSIGILLGDWIINNPSASRYFNSATQMAVILVVTAVSFWFYIQKKYLVFGVLLNVTLLLSGFLSLTLRHESLYRNIDFLTKNKYDFYQATVQNIPEKRAKSIRVDAMIEKIHVDGKWIKADVKAYLSIPQDASQIPSAGDQIVARGNLENPKPPMNPGEFDYRRYLWNKGIVWTDYLPENSYRVIKLSGSQSVNSWAQRISQWSDRQFRENLKDDKSYGLVKAMLLGRRDDLRSDQVDDYTTSGTVHILSVSGMHVAIIFLVLSYLLGWMKRLKGGKYLYLATIMLLLGFYAVVTGLPPSVQRATLMCIVFVVAEVFARKHNAMNTLAISALIILLFDPQAIFDLGFQLSYLAMSGIFLFYRPIESLWMPVSWLWKYIWQITALSFAAQLATFPLSLFYFHQFPFYFWLVNPFVITCTNALLPAALVLLFVCLGPFVWLKTAVGWVVYFFAFLTNISAAVPKNMPGYLIGNLYLDKAEVVLLYALVLLAWYAYESTEFQWLKYMAGLVILFVFYSTSQSFQNYISFKGMIHSVPKHSVVSLKEGDRLFIFSDEAFRVDTNAYDFYIKNYAISEGILETIFLEDSVKTKSLVSVKVGDGKLLSWKNHLIYLGGYFPTKTAIDYLLLTSPKYPKISKIDVSSNTTFLISGEIKKRTAERWQNILQANHVQIHDLQTQGALLLP